MDKEEASRKNWDKVEWEMFAEKERRWERFVEEERQFSKESTSMVIDFVNRMGRRRRERPQS